MSCSSSPETSSTRADRNNRSQLWCLSWARASLKGVTGTVHSVSTLNADGTATGVLTGQVVRPEVRYVVVRKPAHGTVTVDEATGAFTYTPDSEILQNGGPDSFQVMVTDNRFNLFQVYQPFNGDPVRTVNLSVASATV